MATPKTLGTLDLVLFNTVAIVGMRWVALTAHSGPSSLTLWLLAALVFFIPQGLCVMTLSSALPKEGGLYVWITQAFGERHGFLAGWLYWGWRLARAEWFARDIRKALKVLNRDPAALRWELLWFKPTELSGQPLPTEKRGGAEERYELLRKFQGVIGSLGYHGIIVLIDRVDEPQQVEGDPRKMRALMWPKSSSCDQRRM